MGLFSAGFPTGVGVRLTLLHPTLRTGFPLPTRGRPHRPPGGSTATHLQLLKSNTGYPSMQIAKRLVLSAVSRLPENSNHTPIAQPNQPVERPPFLWESPFHPLQCWPNAIHLNPGIPGAPILNRVLCGLGGNEDAHGREMTPRSVSPFTNNCMASATSNNPIILTRIRIPVSPINALTRPAPASTR